ncbi:MAG: hypothetical protein Q9217_001250 [Psora testacea]
MAQKCVHKGCGKKFTEVDEECVYHPGPPVFHEGQKGWKCCKPRVLTFDEFLSIPPCTTGKHSTTDDTSESEPPSASKAQDDLPPPPAPRPIASDGFEQKGAISQAPQPTPPVASSNLLQESDSDDPSTPIPMNTTCKRRGCNATYNVDTKSSREGEECAYHPGQALFHEGSKGWTCCKRRVLEFDEFLKIEGCKSKKKHLFVGSKKDAGQEEKVMDVSRHDYYQTPTAVIASLFLKKIDKQRAKVNFTSPTSIALDLPTTDNTRYQTEIPLFGPIECTRSKYKIMGTKLELTLVKADGSNWGTLRSDEQRPNEIIQLGRPGRV